MAHRPRWTLSQVTELFEKPLLDLLFEAQQVHHNKKHVLEKPHGSPPTLDIVASHRII